MNAQPNDQDRMPGTLYFMNQVGPNGQPGSVFTRIMEFPSFGQVVIYLNENDEEVKIGTTIPFGGIEILALNTAGEMVFSYLFVYDLTVVQAYYKAECGFDPKFINDPPQTRRQPLVDTACTTSRLAWPMRLSRDPEDMFTSQLPSHVVRLI